MSEYEKKSIELLEQILSKLNSIESDVGYLFSMEGYSRDTANALEDVNKNLNKLINK